MMSRLFMAAALFVCSALTAHAASVNYTLYISAGTLNISGTGGTTMPAWGYSTSASGGPRFPGPVLSANEGDSVSITVVNNHNVNHNFVIKGVTSDTTAIAPGGSRTYTFTAPAPGTFIYSDTLNNNVNRAMGLNGMFWVGPVGGGKTVWSGGPSYDFQRTWVVAEVDKPRWNDVAGSGGTVNTSVYKPNYFTMNGMGGFQAMGDANTTVSGSVGQKALIRIINTGQLSHSLHFHGNHIQILRINGVNQPAPFVELDVINVAPMSTIDVIFVLNQPGEYPMHIHTAQMETANGVYLNGVATMIMMH
jgi:FtsP/CotA-like multicopper oxidase with cupredoxin domain